MNNNINDEVFIFIKKINIFNNKSNYNQILIITYIIKN